MLALLALLLAAAWRSEALPISAYDSKVPMEPFCHTNHVACTEAEGNGSNDASIQLDSAMSVNASLRPDPTSRKTVVCSISDAAVARALPEGRCVLDILGRGVISTECLAGIKVFGRAEQASGEEAPSPALIQLPASPLPASERLDYPNPLQSYSLQYLAPLVSGGRLWIQYSVPSHCMVSMTFSATLRCDVCNDGSISASRNLAAFHPVSHVRRTAASVVVDGPYLQSVGRSSALIVWRTTVKDVGVVFVGTSASKLTMKFSTPGGTTDPVVSVTGLKAGIKYYYSIGSPTTTYSSGLSFTLLPALGKGASLRALMLGDPGTGSSVEFSVLNAARSYLKSKGAANMWFLLGDNAYDSGTDAEYSAYVFQVYQKDLKSVPMYAIIGNHDSSSRISSGGGVGPYFDRFIMPKLGEGGGVPSGSGAYYSFDYGKVHFVCLDSWLSDNTPGSRMINWLQEDLAAINPDKTSWLIALWHHPPYSRGTLNSDSDKMMRSMRENVLPIMEAAGVDLIVGGHSHNYERSQFISGHYGTASTFSSSMVVNLGSGTTADPYLKPLGLAAKRGMVSVVAGSSGQISSSSNGLNHPANVVIKGTDQRGSITAGAFVLDIKGADLTGTFVTSTGSILDQFHIRKTSSIPGDAPSAPRSATASPSITPSSSPSKGLSLSASSSRSFTRTPIPPSSSPTASRQLATPAVSIPSKTRTPSSVPVLPAEFVSSQGSPPSSSSTFGTGSIVAVTVAAVVVLVVVVALLLGRKKPVRSTIPAMPRRSVEEVQPMVPPPADSGADSPSPPLPVSPSPPPGVQEQLEAAEVLHICELPVTSAVVAEAHSPMATPVQLSFPIIEPAKPVVHSVTPASAAATIPHSPPDKIAPRQRHKCRHHRERQHRSTSRPPKLCQHRVRDLVRARAVSEIRTTAADVEAPSDDDAYAIVPYMGPLYPDVSDPWFNVQFGAMVPMRPYLAGPAHRHPAQRPYPPPPHWFHPNLDDGTHDGGPYGGQHRAWYW